MYRQFYRAAILTASFGLVVFLPGMAQSGSTENEVTPGEFIVEPPTLICLGFEWSIAGDDNRNAVVEVAYRKRGFSGWKEALPLLRIGGERISDDLDYVTLPMFAGSIFDLEPDTDYECRFTMFDPDGVRGDTVKTVIAHTRAEPRAYSGGRVFHVYPPGYKGKREEPSHTGVKSAFYGPGGDDWGLAAKAQVAPGDVILMHAGLYKSDRMSYSNPLGLTFHGTYVLTGSGSPDRPIVIKAAGDGEAVFDGDGCYRLFDVMAADNILFEGLTIRNTDIAFYGGVKGVGGCSGLTVRDCHMENVGIGVFTEYEGSKNYYIADNTIIGREDPNRLRGWNPRVWAKYGELSTVASFCGIKVYGQGHVICHNSIRYFHDGIDVFMYGAPEKDRDKKCVAIDIYNNDIFMTCDDVIEADGGEHNIRVFRNRGINTALHGLSAQPVYGGPVYFIRNIIYHAVQGGAMKFNNHPSGLLVYHNTFCSEWSSGGQAFSN
ncbi:MAG: right-handed parallel beta-helix repeat-containing protein, partial [Candidatus Latescibacterota bacterium]